jgi:regulator of sigma E protease
MDSLIGAVGNVVHFLFYFVLAYFFVLAMVIFIHELGHYLVGRWCKVRVVSFSLGFGPEIFGFTDKHGTRWRLAAIPLGGYVKFFGDANAASAGDNGAVTTMTAEERSGAFALKPVWQRALIVLAGPMANFILAIGIFTCFFFVQGRAYMVPVVAQAFESSRALEAGFLSGDRLLAVNGRDLRSVSDFIPLVQLNAESPMTVTVERAGETLDVTVTPERVVQNTAFGPVSMGKVGLQFDGSAEHQRFESLSPVGAVGAAVEQCDTIARQTFHFLGRLFAGRENLDQLNGPVGIANITGQVAKTGIENLIWLAAVLSFSIGLVNLFPIPVLDGGHLVFYAIEAIRRRPLKMQVQELGYRIGFGLILTLLVVVSFNDVRKLVGMLIG